MSLNKFLSEVKNGSKIKESIVTNKATKKGEKPNQMSVARKRKIKTNEYIQKLSEYY